MMALVQFMVLRHGDSRDSETPDTLRKHDVTHWLKLWKSVEIVKIDWSCEIQDDLYLVLPKIGPSYVCPSHKCSSFIWSVLFLYFLYFLMLYLFFLSYIWMRFGWFYIQEENKFQCASLPLCADNTLGQIWSYVSTYFTNESDYSSSLIIFVWRVIPSNYWEMQE